MTTKEELIARWTGRPSETAVDDALAVRLVADLPVALFVKEIGTWRFAAWNRAMEEITGIAASDAIGKTDSEVYSEEKAAVFRVEDEKVTSAGLKSDIHEEIGRPDGTVRTVRTIKTRVGGPDDGHILGMCLDLTDLTLYRDELERHRQMVRLSASLAGIGYWEYDHRERRFRADGTTRDIMGVSPDRLDPERDEILSLVHPDDLQGIDASFDLSFAERREFDHQFRVATPGKPIRHVHVRAVHVFDKDDTVIRSLGSLQDVTERVEAQRRVEESDRLKSTFLANMSHEIRTPLNAILGFSKILAQRELTVEERRQFGSIIERNGNQLVSLISDILDLAKIESGQLDIEVAKIDLREILFNVAESFTPMFDEKEGSVTFERAISPTASPFVRGDAVRIRQVISNLLGNALKFTDRGRVTLGLEPSCGDWEIFVKDTGPGIPESERDAVFGRFRQLDDGYRRRHGGAGLGLAISRELVRLMGSELSVESSLGKGSRFSFVLPSA